MHTNTSLQSQPERKPRPDINYNQDAKASGAQIHQNVLQVPREPSPARSVASSTASVIPDNTFVQPPPDYKPEFPWKRVGAFIDKSNPPPFEELVEISASKNASKLAKYISERYYADLYWNCSLVVGMCFFSWFLSSSGFGFLSVLIVAIFGFSIYRHEFRRFNVNIRDDMQRVYAADHLEQKLESMHWLNNFLSKFWVIYMPALSDMVIQSTNEILKSVEPPPPINKLSLDHSTLGSKAPKVDSIKSFTKLGADLYQMDWALNFTPNDTNDMTANELKEKIAPKIALGIRVGKGFVGASLPILVEDMSFEGLLRIKLKIGDTFPHIDVVSICFLEQPKIDYALKPVGGNTFGIDIMSLIPGLSSFVNGLIHSNLAPMMYAPNSLDIDVNDIVESTLPSAIGVLAVKIRGAEYLSDSENVINPYVEFNIESGNPMDNFKTDIKANTSVPVFNEVKHMLITNLQSRMKFQLMNLGKSGESKEIAEAFFELQDLLQSHDMKMIETKLTQNNRNVGKLVYDLVWFPVLKSDEEQDSGDLLKVPESDTGILEFNLISGRDLDNTKSLIGKLSSYAELYIDNELIITSRLAKGTNNPEFKCKLEKLIISKASTSFKILIKDISSFGETTIAQYESTSLAEILLISTKKTHRLDFTTGKGSFIFSSVWKPLPSISLHDDVTFVPPVGVLRVHIVNASNLPNLETLGTIDPYVQILSGGILKSESAVVKNSLNPKFDDVFYISMASKNEKVKLRVMDVESGDKDREVGSVSVDLKDILNDSDNQNKKFKFEGQLSRNGKPTGTINYVLSYYPLLPLYSHREVQNIIAKQQDDNQVDDLEELEEQAKFLEDFKKHPDAYEWVEEDNQLEEDLASQGKIMMSVEDATKNKSGVLGLNLIRGSSKNKTCYVEALIDDRAYPDFISRKCVNGKFSAHSGDAFIRDLPNSIVTFRLTKTQHVKSNEQVISMTSEPFKVMDLLEKGYDQPMKIDIGGSIIDFMFEFIPSEIGMSAHDSVTDTGLMSIKLLRGIDLPAADSNGFSDPFAILKSNDAEVFRSKTVKKTLNPEWNETTQAVIKSRERTKFTIEVYDWDMAGKNDYLGAAVFDLQEMDLNKVQVWKLPLDTNKGSIIEIETKFSPGYIRPGLGVMTNDSMLGLPGAVGVVGELGALGIGAAANVGAMGVGAAANVGALGVGAAANVGALGLGAATDVTGGALNVAGSAVHGVTGGAGGLLKRLNGSKRTSTSSFRPMPPSPGHQHSKSSSVGNTTSRSSMDVSSVHTDTFNGMGVLAGRMSINKMDSVSESSGSYHLRVDMVSASKKHKTIHRTKAVKLADGELQWNEQVALRCDPQGSLVFEVREHHLLGKDKVVAQAMLNLADIVGLKDDYILKTSAGNLHLNFNYGA